MSVNSSNEDATALNKKSGLTIPDAGAEQKKKRIRRADIQVIPRAFSHHFVSI
jgi:hypothetical protein